MHLKKISFRNAIFEDRYIIGVHCDCGNLNSYDCDGDLDPNWYVEMKCKFCGKTISFNLDGAMALKLTADLDGDSLPIGLIFRTPTEFLSSFDTTLRLVNLAINEPPDIKELERSNITRSKFSSFLRNRLPEIVSKKYRESLLHEYHHSFQTVFYPFLYIQSWLEQDIYYDFRNWMRTSHEDFSFDNFNLDAGTKGTLYFQFSEIYMEVSPDDQLISTKETSNSKNFWKISIVDLLEVATSIFEYKFVAGQKNCFSEFIKWLQTNTRYDNVFRLTSAVLGQESAYKYLPALVQISFHTTFPVGAFGTLVNFLKFNGLHELGWNIDRMHDVLLNAICNPPFPEEIEFQVIPPLNNIPKTVITFDGYKKIVAKSYYHTAYPMVMRFLGAVTQDPEFPKLLYHSDDQHNIKRIVDTIPPIGVIVSLPPPYYMSLDRIFAWDSEYTDPVLSPSGRSMCFQEYVLETIRQKEFFFDIIFNRENQSLRYRCPRTECKYYRSRLCRSWCPPQNDNICGFSNWIRSALNRDINLKNGTFTRIKEVGK